MRCVFRGGQIRVAEAGQATEHLREDVPVEAPIDLGGLSEEIVPGEVLRELEDVGEVASLSPVEQGNDLAARQLTGCESRADEAGGGWVFGWGVQREIDQQVVVAVDDEPAERRLVSDPVDGPAL